MRHIAALIARKNGIRGTVILGALLLFAQPTSAQERTSCVDVGFNNNIEVGGTALVLNGLGLREATIANVDVYVAALYLPARSSNAGSIISTDQTWRLILRFVRDVDQDDITEAFQDGFEENSSNVSSIQSRINQLNGWMEDVEETDRLQFTYVPGTGLEVEVKGSVKGTIAGHDFASAFISIWLGDDPPNRGLKRGMLGGECG